MKVEMTRFAFEGTSEEFKNVKRTFATLGKPTESSIPYQQLTQDNPVQETPKSKPAKKEKAKKTDVIEQVVEEDGWEIAE